MAASKYLNDALINWMKGTTFPTPPTSVYMALLTTNPSDNNGTGLVEVSGGSYARKAIPGWGSISTSGTDTEEASTNGAVTFAAATADWGTVTGVALYDNTSAGNLLFNTDITDQVINSGNQFSYPSGNATLQAS